MDAFETAIDRADGILSSLFWAFNNEGDYPDDLKVVAALDAAIYEINDVKMLVGHYFESTGVQNPPLSG